MRMDELRALRHPAERVFALTVRKEGIITWQSVCSPRSPSPRDIPTKSATRSPTPVLDDILAADPTAHVACETFTTTGIVTVMGEITTKHYTDIPSIVRRTVERIGYTDPAYGFDYRSCAVMTAIDEQSPDIAMGVNESYELQQGGTDEADRIGAGDQGMMFGYACDETPS